MRYWLVAFALVLVMPVPGVDATHPPERTVVLEYEVPGRAWVAQAYASPGPARDYTGGVRVPIHQWEYQAQVTLTPPAPFRAYLIDQDSDVYWSWEGCGQETVPLLWSGVEIHAVWLVPDATGLDCGHVEPASPKGTFTAIIKNFAEPTPPRPVVPQHCGIHFNGARETRVCPPTVQDPWQHVPNPWPIIWDLLEEIPDGDTDLGTGTRPATCAEGVGIGVEDRYDTGRRAALCLSASHGIGSVGGLTCAGGGLRIGVGPAAYCIEFDHWYDPNAPPIDLDLSPCPQQQSVDPRVGVLGFTVWVCIYADGSGAAPQVTAACGTGTRFTWGDTWIEVCAAAQVAEPARVEHCPWWQTGATLDVLGTRAGACIDE